ncbi:family 43 glycosylhydrolase [Luteimicrobium sp. DT211]|uniref:family 43 glycosylhydrolase n=1 Tax=Luteimicrobium sp. DT211 TaxID=3393412 RepID=UPI003CF58BD3
MRSGSHARRRRAPVALAVGAALAATALLGAVPPATAATVVPAADDPTPPSPTRTITSPGNPIIKDGSLYTADAATLVGDDGRLYVYAGHDEAGPQTGTFVMHDYTVMATDDVASGRWDVYEDDLDPATTFAWADGNAAYAGQVAAGTDGKYYWYVPIETKDASQPSRMAFGVAVSDTPVGPWKDAIGKPLLTWKDVFGTSTDGQELIDPTIFRDDDGKVYLYWGSWGVARMVELDPGMTTLADPAIRTVSGLSDFYEAPWVFKKGELYYLLYDWKRGGSDCTPSNYQACIAYATATSPTGPWTYQGIILSGTSATTVHPSMIEFKGQWYLTYHTKDAEDGGHFRRSVAIDEAQWDGTKILPVKQTLADDPAYRLTTNVAPDAQVTASYTEQPPMRTTAVNDGFRATTALLPPDQWGNYRSTTSTVEKDWLSYQWDAPVRTGSVGIEFHRDSNWIRPPASWTLEYLDAGGDWKPVQDATYPTGTDTWQTVTFTPVTTTALRATFAGQPEGAYVHSVSVSEWEVYADAPSSVAPVAVTTKPGTAPDLPPAVRTVVDGQLLWAPVTWRPVDAADYAQEGTFQVQGRVLGDASGYLEATVDVTDDAPPTPPADGTAPTVSLAPSGTAGADGWFSSAVTVRVSADDDTDYLTRVSAKVGDGAWKTVDDARHLDVTVSAEGTTTVVGKAEDASGNVSDEVSRTVKVDTTKPVATAHVDADARTVTVDATDALSGVASLRYQLDGKGPWSDGTLGKAIGVPDALPHTVAYRVSDKAGNAATGSAVVPLGDDVHLTGDVAGYATASASFTSSWENAGGLNDGTNGLFENDAAKVGTSWGTWPQVGRQTATLTWPFAVTVDRTGVWWYRDSPDDAGGGMIPPKTWTLQYLDPDGTTWHDVVLADGSTYGRDSDGFATTAFAPVTTTALRVVADSWGAADGGGSTGIREWQVVAAETEESTSPELAFVTPKDGATVSGKVAVTVDLAGQGLKAYNLRVDSAGLSYAWKPKAGAQTFAWDTTTVADGVHTLLATATDDAGHKTTVTRKVTVDNAPKAPRWDAGSVYLAGDRVAFGGAVWLASWWTQKQKPGDVNGPWQEVATAPEGTAVWTPSRIFDSGDTAVFDGVTYRAQWWTRNEKPGVANGPWKKLG